MAGWSWCGWVGGEGEGGDEGEEVCGVDAAVG